MIDAALMSDGVIMNDNILTASGSMMGNGTPFMSCGSLLGDGSLMIDGVLLADVSAQAGKALINGDNTASMSKAAEGGLVPKTPSGLTAAASKTQINLTWADNSSDETGFKVERSTDGVTYTQLTTPAANSRSYASMSLTGGKKYYYRVRAYNSNGNSAYTAVATATTPTK